MAKKASKGSGKEMTRIEIDRELSSEQGEALLQTLHERFEANKSRHKGIQWADVRAKLEKQPEKLASLGAMERTGGEPDVTGYDKKAGEYIFTDCAEQSPDGRRSICYDGPAQREREKKGVYPAGNAVDLAADMGIELLTEEAYWALQELGEFDTKTESWIKTPDEMRELGGALFCCRRYERVFVYQNSAPSFYAARGFRGSLRV